MEIIWKALLLIFGGLIFLRIAGRKSISEMTVAETIVMISIGTIIVAPLAGKSLGQALTAAGVFIAFLMLVEYLEVKFNFIEKLITGKSLVVIKDGVLESNNLRKVRVTVDDIEMRLRQAGISSIKDVKTATIEPNGQLGYELMHYAKPVTIGELEKILDKYFKKPLATSVSSSSNIFAEVKENEHKRDIPPELQ